MLTDDQTLSSQVRFLPLEYNIFQSLNVDVLFVSDLCVFLATMLVPQSSLPMRLPMGTASFQSLKRQIPIQPG